MVTEVVTGRHDGEVILTGTVFCAGFLTKFCQTITLYFISDNETIAAMKVKCMMVIFLTLIATTMPCTTTCHRCSAGSPEMKHSKRGKRDKKHLTVPLCVIYLYLKL